MRRQPPPPPLPHLQQLPPLRQHLPPPPPPPPPPPLLPRRHDKMERDRRGLRLSSAGGVLTVLAFVAAIAAAAAPNWANFAGAMSGHFGPWLVCQGDIYVTCTSYSSRFQSSWQSKVAGIGSAAAAALLAVAAFMCPLLVMMHLSSTKVLIKFRHATLAKVVCTGASVLCGMVSLLFFVIEVFISKSGISYGLVISLSWAFYLQGLSVVLGIVAGVGAGIEFGWSRKLGGDPTVYGRDPEGTAATTISNPSFRDSRNGHSKTASHQRSSGRIHRNANGVAMTHFSGQPYMITANGSNGHLARTNGGMRVAFDPNRTPLRSSLRKPKPAPPEDGPDSSLGIQNLAFTQSSPPTKKKVRIHTQSTSV